MPERWFNFLATTFPNPKSFVVTAASTATSVWGVLNQENAVAIAFALVAVGSALGPPLQKAVKWYRDFRRQADVDDRNAKLALDTAEADVWSVRVANANAAKGEFEGKLNAALEQIDQLKARVAAADAKAAAAASLAENQAEEIRDNRHKTRNLEQELVLHKAAAAQATAEAKNLAKQAGRIAVASQDQLKTQGERIAAVEHIAGSSSAMEFPVVPPPPETPNA